MVHFVRPAFLLYALLALSVYGSAQSCDYNISGTVTDKQSHPLQGVIVHLLHAAQGDATDTNGHFFIKQVCSGIDTLICEAIGYQQFAAYIFINSDKHIDARLSLDNNSLAEVVVMGNDCRTSIQ